MKKYFSFFLLTCSFASQHQVISGSVDVQFEGQRWDITAETDRSILHWDEFSIPADHAMHFHLPAETSALLNRVHGELPSHIQGALHSNGAVYLVNPNGIIIGQDAFINVASLVATTLDFSNEDFLGGHDLPFQGSSLASLENSGKLVASNGDVILFAHRIVNKGTIEAENALLGTGHEILLCFEGIKHFYIKPSSEVADLLLNEGTISASNVVLQAVSQPSAFALKNSGAISVVQEEGKVYLRAKGGFLENRGRVTAPEIAIQATEGAETTATPIVYNHGTLDGGAISLDVAKAYNFGTISANGIDRGGTISIHSQNFYIETQDAKVSADGALYGGEISIIAKNYYTSGTTSANGNTAGNLSIDADRIVLAAGHLHASGKDFGGKITLVSHSDKYPITLNPHARIHAHSDANPGTIEIHTSQKPNACRGNFPNKHNFMLNTYSEEGYTTEGLEVLGACIGDELEFIDPNQSGTGSTFGNSITPLSTGNVVITKTADSSGASNAGAVYLFNGSTAAAITTLTGSTANDQIGSGGVTALTDNGNFVISSPLWDNGGATDAGAATWVSGTDGLAGVVGANNSLVGSAASDSISSTGITALSNGNYVVGSEDWASGVGAATWGSGSTGVAGTVSVANSLIGSTAGDNVSGNGLIALTNGNYVVGSASWDNPTGNMDVGAATWGNGLTGITGTVSVANSLTGLATNDFVGSALLALTNDNYVVLSSAWAGNTGAATWGNGLTGITGTVSVANSLTGSVGGDRISGNVNIALTNGNYVVGSSAWAGDTGAATWGNGTTGVTGTVSAANSLVGSASNNFVTFPTMIALTNGNYVVQSSAWDNGATTDVGAVTWGNGSTGITGTVSISNSLIGSTAIDFVGSDFGTVALTNGNYVVSSPIWDNPAGNANVGAATWGNGTTGITGTVSISNSLIGTTGSDFVSNIGITALANGNYVVRSQSWDNPAGNANVGAITWGNGTTGITGTVSIANSLIGSAGNDLQSHTFAALSNGNYVVGAPSWDDPGGGDTGLGAATWGDGTTGIAGTISIANSLIGSSQSDSVGSSLTGLANGNFVLATAGWDNGGDANVGAVTLGDGETGTACDAYGTVSTDNSFIGANAFAQLSSTVTSDTVNQNFFVQFNDYNSQTTVFAFNNGTPPPPPPPPPSPPSPASSAAAEVPPAKGRVNYNIAISEAFQQWTSTFLRGMIESNDAPPMWTHKQFPLPLRSLVPKPEKPK